MYAKLRSSFFCKANAYFRLTAVAVILVNREFSLLCVFFQINYKEMNGKADIVEAIKFDFKMATMVAILDIVMALSDIMTRCPKQIQQLV